MEGPRDKLIGMWRWTSTLVPLSEKRLEMEATRPCLLTSPTTVLSMKMYVPLSGLFTNDAFLLLKSKPIPSPAWDITTTERLWESQIHVMFNTWFTTWSGTRMVQWEDKIFQFIAKCMWRRKSEVSKTIICYCKLLFFFQIKMLPLVNWIY